MPTPTFHSFILLLTPFLISCKSSQIIGVSAEGPYNAELNTKSNSLLRPTTQGQDPANYTSCPGHGSCMSKKACEEAQGIRKMGQCPLDSEVCCKIPSKCGLTSNEWVSNFVTPGYPALFNGSTECIFTLDPLPGVCAVRFDFKDVELAASNKYTTTHKCLIDSMYILNIPNSPTEPLCDLHNYSGIVFLEQNNARPIKFLFVIQSHSWKVKLQATQVKCDDIQPWQNEPQCGRQLMYDAPLDDNQLQSADFSTHSRENALIVNGQTAEVREFPWQVSIQGPSGSHRCGASIIGRNLLLSAAHCVAWKKDLDKLSIRLGDVNSTLEGDVVEIESIVQHYEYKPFKSYVNDIAIIRLKNNITFSSVIQPICLPQPGEKIESGTGIVSGWGSLSGFENETGNSPLYLQKLDVHFLPNGDCTERMNRAYSVILKKNVRVEPISSKQICAIAEKNSTVCFGDSGGPLVRVNSTDGTYTQVGIVSYGIGRCIIKDVIPVVYTRVTEFLRFIAIAAQT